VVVYAVCPSRHPAAPVLALLDCVRTLCWCSAAACPPAHASWPTRGGGGEVETSARAPAEASSMGGLVIAASDAMVNSSSTPGAPYSRLSSDSSRTHASLGAGAAHAAAVQARRPAVCAICKVGRACSLTTSSGPRFGCRCCLETCWATSAARLRELSHSPSTRSWGAWQRPAGDLDHLLSGCQLHTCAWLAVQGMTRPDTAAPYDQAGRPAALHQACPRAGARCCTAATRACRRAACPAARVHRRC